jgi:release factor glutamine methyltransferase
VPYQPDLSPNRVAELRRWHERAYQSMRAAGEQRLPYLGVDLVVPAGVFAPTPTSDLLGRAVLAEAQSRDRVLDMGTGSGVNAILAAQVAHDVVGVDVNPDAVVAARANAARNGVSADFAVSDVIDEYRLRSSQFCRYLGSASYRTRVRSDIPDPAPMCAHPAHGNIA